jgi:hypothetical protein
MCFKRKYLSDKTLVNLKNYKYVSGEYSLFDHLFTPYWNFCVSLLPIWMAPNLVTLIGLFFMSSSALTYVYYDTTMSQDLNPWLYAYTALVIFIYQTLDAIDGK